VLLAVIFRFNSAPYSQTGFETGISQNNSVVFSRISDILGLGSLPGKIVSDGEVVRVKEQVLYRFYGSFRSPKLAFFMFSPSPLIQPKKRSFTSHGSVR
jgi:hypothetical protein